MDEKVGQSDRSVSVSYVNASEDRFGEHRGLGISEIKFKVTQQESSALFAMENIFHEPGGPARHLHYDQDEWFYALEGEFIVEVGEQRYTMLPGDSLFAPRNVSHVWAHVGAGMGRMLIVFAPAGEMESFFREVTKSNAMPVQDPELWHAHGMELLGPPLALE